MRRHLQLNFVLCPRFHGATTLALLLNNHSSVSSLGDMFPSGEFDQSCGCGRKVSQCPFWQMLDRRYQGMRGSRSRSLYPAWPQLLERESANAAAISAISVAALYSTPRVWQMLGGAAGRFIDFYVDFVHTVNECNHASVFVNGQKSLRSVLAIKSILGDRAQVSIIHLFRDPRGFCCSEQTDDARIGIDESAGRWRSYHSRVTKLVRPLAKARYLAIRYEDVCERPRPTMSQVFEFLGVEDQDVFKPAALHHVVGHRTKGQFDGVLHQSQSWRDKLSASEQERCLALTRPESERMDYRPLPRMEDQR